MANEIPTANNHEQLSPVEQTIVFVFGPVFLFRVFIGVNFNGGDGSSHGFPFSEPTGVDAATVAAFSHQHF